MAKLEQKYNMPTIYAMFKFETDEEETIYTGAVIFSNYNYLYDGYTFGG